MRRQSSACEHTRWHAAANALQLRTVALLPPAAPERLCPSRVCPVCAVPALQGLHAPRAGATLAAPRTRGDHQQLQEHGPQPCDCRGGWGAAARMRQLRPTISKVGAWCTLCCTGHASLEGFGYVPWCPGTQRGIGCGIGGERAANDAPKPAPPLTCGCWRRHVLCGAELCIPRVP